MKMNRRGFVAGLAAVPLVGGVEWVEAQKKPQDARTTDRILYLFFHGMYAFHVKDDSIVAWAPDVKDGQSEHHHKYRVGRKPTDLKAITNGQWIRIAGHTGAPGDPFNGLNLVRFDPGKLARSGWAFSVSVPRPNRIHSLLLAEAILREGSLPPRKICAPTLQCFAYVLEPGHTVETSPGIAVKPEFEDGYGRLHFYAEPDRTVGKKHAMEAFRKLAKLTEMDKEVTDVPKNGCLDAIQPPDGVRPEDLAPLPCQMKPCDKPRGISVDVANCMSGVGP